MRPLMDAQDAATGGNGCPQVPLSAESAAFQVEAPPIRPRDRVPPLDGSEGKCLPRGTVVLKGGWGGCRVPGECAPLASVAKASASLAGPLAPLNRRKAQNPPTLTMVMEVVKTLNERKGRCILGTYPGVEPIRLKYSLKVALARGLERGWLIRPQNSSALGATGRFKLGPAYARGKKSPEKHSDSDGKTAPTPKEAAKVPVEKARLGAIAEGEKEEAGPSTSTKAKAIKDPGKPPAKPKAWKESKTGGRG
ncbi:sperm-specific protein PHI-2B/PHI-3-like [Podarcis lilfordi]|uniref:Sperm-specific protein PHI-2B/PHI-3-like n=1 Tax=Podarcis lilfordi TaxID=74358 RepID=A0AA35LLU2_9SAUR|nr:sperm-specific protein PHI-2B/PHI-3-like [Podarcis lilfordi]